MRRTYPSKFWKLFFKQKYINLCQKELKAAKEKLELVDALIDAYSHWIATHPISTELEHAYQERGFLYRERLDLNNFINTLTFELNGKVEFVPF